MPHRLKHALLTFAAIIFLIEAWLWDVMIALGRGFVRLLPWQAFKDAVARLIERLPPYGALLLFVIPVAVVEPLKVVAVRQMAHGHLFSGLLVLAALKFVGLGVFAFVFDLTRDKVLAIGWFARFYYWVLMWRERAHAFIAPYKAAVLARLAALRAEAARLGAAFGLPASRGGLIAMLGRVRARIRRSARTAPLD
ncbi:hypothetical protein K9U39_10315 [Rhodoblastus acidophilus]|uniref:Transmembrane protein n=1 Tax=Candidatus Rhodoblastus alkanivorans TaxID=2954117 RepID=A0ABS9ZBI9_9HYPH|nr:hypothetical protein [Candidatus Rhodoblastus alkanivorans]MCI4680340.1 hypothetical protein [Candidatus Rhodoblastus alkanivorans]MCI4684007.1 hypothetical protein [Candidatus Rhodoblastus alkanivorans]MDI4641326.1 hypothetical protein [Rhodoblastus acidophilus]